MIRRLRYDRSMLWGSPRLTESRNHRNTKRRKADFMTPHYTPLPLSPLSLSSSPQNHERTQCPSARTNEHGTAWPRPAQTPLPMHNRHPSADPISNSPSRSCEQRASLGRRALGFTAQTCSRGLLRVRQVRQNMLMLTPLKGRDIITKLYLSIRCLVIFPQRIRSTHHGPIAPLLG